MAGTSACDALDPVIISGARANKGSKPPDDYRGCAAIDGEDGCNLSAH